MKAKEFAERIAQLPPDKEVVDMYWCDDDVWNQANELELDITHEQMCNVIDLLSSKHDANIGINWETINYWLMREVSEND